MKWPYQSVSIPVVTGEVDTITIIVTIDLTTTTGLDTTIIIPHTNNRTIISTIIGIGSRYAYGKEKPPFGGFFFTRN